MAQTKTTERKYNKSGWKLRQFKSCEIMPLLKINQLTNEEKGMKQAGHITIDHKYVEIHFTGKKFK